jgi:N-acetylneuraminate synthase
MLNKILKSKPYVIAEIGANHNGSFNKAILLIQNAKKAGCDAVKFQSWDENLNCKEYYEKNPNNLKEYLKYKLSFDQLSKLRKFSKKIKIDFGTTPFTSKQIKDAIKLKCDFIKIASMDLNNYPFINEVSKLKKNLIISTGFSSSEEILNTCKILKKNKKKNVIFLHCIGLYPPANENQLNLNNIKMLKKLTGYESGFSDHTTWRETPLAASALGAVVIEKHFTFNKKAPGWDHSVSADLNEMKDLVSSSKRFFKLPGKFDRKLSKEELSKSKIMRRSITTKHNIIKGQKLKLKDLDFQRPGSGISPGKLPKILGKKVKKNISLGRILKWSDFN